MPFKLKRHAVIRYIQRFKPEQELSAATLAQAATELLLLTTAAQIEPRWQDRTPNGRTSFCWRLPGDVWLITAHTLGPDPTYVGLTVLKAAQIEEFTRLQPRIACTR